MAKRKVIKRPGKGPAAPGGMGGGLGGLGGGGQSAMLQRLQMLQQQMEEAQASLADELVVGTAGGGVVKVTLTADQHCKGVEVAKELLEDGDVDILQDLLVSAFNNALDAARAKSEEKMAPFSSALGGMDLPF